MIKSVKQKMLLDIAKAHLPDNPKNDFSADMIIRDMVPYLENLEKIVVIATEALESYEDKRLSLLDYLDEKFGDEMIEARETLHTDRTAKDALDKIRKLRTVE